MAHHRTFVLGAVLGLLAACTDDTAQNNTATDTNTASDGTVEIVEQLARVASENNAGTTAKIEKLHIVEKYCIEYEHSGAMQTGTSKECLRKWGLEQASWENTTISMGGFSQSQNQRSIVKGKSVISFDPQTLQGTKMDNPYYEAMAGAAQKTGPEEFTNQMIAAMGFASTDQTKQIAGEKCKVYAGQMGTMCMTDDGLTLETSIAGMVKKATKVDRSTGGTDTDYAVPDGIVFTEVPDLGKLLQGNTPQQ